MLVTLGPDLEQDTLSSAQHVGVRGEGGVVQGDCMSCESAAQLHGQLGSSLADHLTQGLLLDHDSRAPLHNVLQSLRAWGAGDTREAHGTGRV